jgi:hypothetical protein
MISDYLGGITGNYSHILCKSQKRHWKALSLSCWRRRRKIPWKTCTATCTQNCFWDISFAYLQTRMSHTPESPRKFCSIDEFLVNDRQDLFDMFSSRHIFLDFDFDTARLITDTFKNHASFSFLSKRVSVETSFHKPLGLNHASTTDFRARADSLVA